jgi:hypothetical protein
MSMSWIGCLVVDENTGEDADEARNADQISTCGADSISDDFAHHQH